MPASASRSCPTIVEQHEQLRRADRLSTLGKLAGGLAHQLGTPLNVIAGRAAMIAQQSDDASAASNARIIAEQVRKMTAIVSELVQVARRRSVDSHPQRIDELVEEALALLAPLAEGRSVALRFEPGANGSTASCDRLRMLQVLTNLVHNALDAVEAGGEVTVSVREEDVDEPADDHAEPGRYVAIAIRDDGAGMPEELRGKPFRPFVSPERDVGLGLYVSSGIMREHAGWIAIDSEPGRGCCATVYLPAGPASHKGGESTR